MVVPQLDGFFGAIEEIQGNQPSLRNRNNPVEWQSIVEGFTAPAPKQMAPGEMEYGQGDQFMNQAQTLNNKALGMKAPAPRAPAFRTTDLLALVGAALAGKHAPQFLQGYLGGKQQKAQQDTQYELQQFLSGQKAVMGEADALESQAKQMYGRGDRAVTRGFQAEESERARQAREDNLRYQQAAIDNRFDKGIDYKKYEADMKRKFRIEELQNVANDKKAMWVIDRINNAKTKDDQDSWTEVGEMFGIKYTPGAKPTAAMVAFEADQAGKKLTQQATKARMTYQEMINKNYPERFKKEMEKWDQQIADSKSAVAKRNREGGPSIYNKDGTLKLTPETKMFLNLQLGKLNAEEIELKNVVENAKKLGNRDLMAIEEAATLRLQSIAKAKGEVKGKLNGTVLLAGTGQAPTRTPNGGKLPPADRNQPPVFDRRVTPPAGGNPAVVKRRFKVPPK